MNLLEELYKIEDGYIKEHWNNTRHIPTFALALKITTLIRNQDTLNNSSDKEVRDFITTLARGYGLKVITKRETNGTWEG